MLIQLPMYKKLIHPALLLYLQNQMLKAVQTLSYSGLAVGLVGGCLVGNRHVSITYKEKTICFKYSMPIVSGVLCAVLFPSLLVCSPIIMIDYYGNLCAVDKWIDKLPYSFEYKRYHQHGPNDDIYYAPSNINIIIKI